MKTNLSDGLYRVATSYLCAGFVVKNSTVIRIAPILIKKFNYFKTIAIKVK